MINELKELLQQEIDLQSNFLSLCNAKTTALVKLDFDRINEATANEQIILSSLSSIINTRVKLQKKVAGNKDMTITDIAKSLDEPQRSEIHKIAETLRNIIFDANKAISKNKALTEAFLSTTNEFFKTICQNFSENFSYSRTGDNLKAPVARLMIDQVI